MVASGFWLLFLFGAAFLLNARRALHRNRWLLYLAVISIPIPWIAIETGWVVAEYGRQPWAIGEVLPTFMATSSLTANDLLISIIGFALFYTLLAIVEFYLMFKFARLGPSSLHTGRYHFEKKQGTAPLATQPRQARRD
jgi:cytochrome d ubiquinol oxidase subunit I